MNIIDITDENMEEYRDILPAEYMNEIGREYYRGLAGVDEDTGELLAGLFWEVRNVEQERVDNVAEIRWFDAKSREDGGMLLEAFDIRNGYDDVRSSFFELTDLAEHEQAALERKGFQTKTTEGMDLYLTVEEIGKLDIAKKPAEDYVRSLSELTSFQFKAGIMNSVFHERYGLLDDLPFLPMSRYDQDISCCVMTDDKVTGLLLVHQVKPALLRVELLFSEQLDAAVNVLNMVRFSIRASVKYCEPTDEYIVRRHSRRVADLSKKLFPGKKGRAVLRGIRK